METTVLEQTIKKKLKKCGGSQGWRRCGRWSLSSVLEADTLLERLRSDFTAPVNTSMSI